MKKRILETKLNLKKNLVSNLQLETIKGAGSNICTGLQETCGGCELPTRNPCGKPSRGWCPQN